MNLKEILDWFKKNKEWMFSGIGVVIITTILSIFFDNKTQELENEIEKLRDREVLLNTNRQELENTKQGLEREINRLENDKQTLQEEIKILKKKISNQKINEIKKLYDNSNEDYTDFIRGGLMRKEVFLENLIKNQGIDLNSTLNQLINQREKLSKYWGKAFVAYNTVKDNINKNNYKELKKMFEDREEYKKIYDNIFVNWENSNDEEKLKQIQEFLNYPL